MKRFRSLGTIFGIIIMIGIVAIAKINAASQVDISASDVTTSFGENVQIPVSIQNSTDLLGFGFEVTYDEAYLEPDSVDSGNLIEDGNFDDSIGTKYANPFRVIWAGTSEIKSDGEIFVLKFHAKKSGSTTVKISGMKDDTYDGSYNKLDTEEIIINVDIICEHDYSKDIIKKATCTEEGIAGYTCSVCDDYYEEYIEKEEHDYTVTVTEATCIRTGQKEYACKSCGYHYTEILETIAHDYELIDVKEATSETAGMETYKCRRCGDTYTKEISGSNAETTADSPKDSKEDETETTATVEVKTTEADVDHPTTAKNGEDTTSNIESPSTTIPEESDSRNVDETTVKEEPTTGTNQDKTTTDATQVKETESTTAVLSTTKAVNNRVAKITKLKAKKKALKVTWKKANGVNGYQIQYSLKRNFKKAKTITLNKASATKKTIKKLKSKKKYFVRLRTFVVVNKENVYSKWSKAKGKKTK